MHALGTLFKIIGGIIFAIAGIWGMILCFKIIIYAAGFWGLVVGLFILPITFVAAPIYAGLAWGVWFPLVLNYGGGLIPAIFYGIGSKLKNE